MSLLFIITLLVRLFFKIHAGKVEISIDYTFNYSYICVETKRHYRTAGEAKFNYPPFYQKNLLNKIHLHVHIVPVLDTGESFCRVHGFPVERNVGGVTSQGAGHVFSQLEIERRRDNPVPSKDFAQVF